MLFCVSFSAVNYVDYAFRIAESYELASFWLNFAVFVVLPPCFLFHFALVLAGKTQITKKKIFYILLYGVNGGYVLFALFSDLVDPRPLRTSYGWTYGNAKFQFISDIFFFEEILLILLSTYLFAKIYYQKESLLKAQQAKLVLIGIALGLGFYFLSDFIFSDFSSLSLIFIIIFLGYGMRKYRLFFLTIQSRSKEIVDKLSDSLILINPKGTITALNDMTLNLLKYNKKQLINNDIRKILYSKDDVKIFNFQLQLLLNFRKKDIVNDIEMNFKTSDNKIVPISLSASKIRDNLGNLKGLILIAREIAERKRIKQELHEVLEKQKMYIDEILKRSSFKSEFMSSLSHELRTPLNSIIGFTELLIEESYGNLNENQLDFLEDIKYSSEHLLELIDALLDISKIESNQLKIHKKFFNFEELIKEISATIMPLYKRKDLKFQIKGLYKNKKIFADRSKVKQIFLNLLGNAIKFTKHGEIKIKIEENDNFWIFHIIDTGVGIPKDRFDDVFREFKRIENSDIKNQHGTGLGLPLSKEMVQMHGGEIWFKSEVGKGSIFSFSLPKKSERF